MSDYSWEHPLDETGIITSTTGLNFEQTTVSPHVNQFMVDYMFVRDKLTSANIDPLVDMGIGDGDLALSITNDAYNQKHVADQISEEVAVKNCMIAAKG